MNWAEHKLIKNGDVVSVAQWAEFDWLKQGFSLRSAGNVGYRFGDATAARARIAANLGVDPESWTGMQQVHGTHIEVVTVEQIGKGSHDYESAIPETDGLITREANALLAVVVADCVPLLFVDPVTRTVAAVHAGRRGTQAGIAKIALEEMVKMNCSIQDIQVAIGPSIGPCCYEINPETHEHFDLWNTNEQQLQESGVQTIIRTDLCTNDHADLFFSHRADDQPGRFAGLISIS